MEKEWTLEMMLAEDDRRHNEIFKEYDPITGVGCYDFDNRVLVRIGDIKFSEMYVPKICFGYPMFRDVARCHYALYLLLTTLFHSFLWLNEELLS